MKKYFSLMILFVMCVFVGIAGCGDIYENVSIRTSTNEITLYVNGDTDENGNRPASQTITANIEGIQDASITSNMFVRFDNPAIATSGDFSYDGNTGTVTITAQSGGSTDMYIVSSDNSLRVESEPIKVTVIEEVESIVVNDAVKGSVALGESISLTGLDNITYHHVTATQTELDFYFYQEQNGVVTGSTTADSGNLVITQSESGEYFLYASPQATVGTVRILVKSAYANGFTDSKLVKTFDVMVYDGFDESGIKVFDITSGTEQASEISALTLLENYGGTNVVYNQKRLSLSVENHDGEVISENLKYSLVPKTNSDKGYVGVTPVNGYENFFDVQAQMTGTATYEIQISVVDSNGTEYLVKTKDFVFTVSRIVDAISISNNNTTTNYNIDKVNTPLEVNVFQAGSYSGGLYGTEIISKVNTASVSNDRFMLAFSEVTILDEETNETTTYDSASAEITNYQQYIQLRTENNRSVNFGDIISNEMPIYVAINGTPTGERITSFVLSFVANYETGLPSFAADVRCLVCESVEEIIAPENVLMKNGTTTTVTFTAGVGVAYNSRFGYSWSNQSVVDIDMLATSLTFEITALSAGTVTLTVTEKDTRISASITITVVEVGEYTWLSVNSSDEASIRQIIMQDTPVYDDTSEANQDIYSIKEVVVTCGTSFGVVLNISPSNATIVSSTVTPEVSENSNITSAVIYGSLLTISTNSVESSTNISVNVSYYVEEDGNLVLHAETLVFTVTTFVPYTSFNWGAGQTTINTSIYDRDSLSLANQNQEDVGFMILTPYLSSSSSRQYQLTYEFTTDTTGITIEMVDPNNSLAGVRIYANLGGETDSVRLEVFFEEYGRLASIYCDVSILQPKQVESIQLRGDEELYLEAGATESSSYYQATIQTQTSPVDALDSSLTYVLMLGDEVISSTYINSNQLFTSYFGEYTSATSPLLFKYENGNIITYINSSLDVDSFSSEYTVRVVPSSMLNLATTDEAYLSLFESITVFADQKIIVGTGTELNPFRVSTEQDLIAISTKGLDRHYVLMNDIELTSAWNIPSGTFSGSLSSYQYTSETSNFIISGFYFDEVITTANVSHKIGFFEELSADASITNVDFEFLNSTVLINTSDSNVVNLTSYVGLLSGVNHSSNVSNVSFFPQGIASLSVQIGENARRTVGVGGLVGINESGSIISDVSGEINISVQNLSSNVSLYVGGALGENRATLSGESVSSKNLWTSSISVNSNISPASSGVGGLVGRNNQQVSNISNFEVMTTIDARNINYVGGITGLNSGVINETFVSPKIVANNYVGGAVGNSSANASVTNVYVEFFYDQTNTNHASITANEYVGGFIGQNSGQITTSYVHSYVPLTMVTQTETLDSTTFYGDIIAYNYVGGFVGYSESSQIQSCFANLQIGVLGSFSDTDKIAGGFVGRLSNYNANQVVQFSYAITKILVNSNDVTNIGVFAGQLDITATAIYNSYAVCDDGNGYEYLQTEQLLSNGNNFIGSSNRASATSRCYYADSGVSETSGTTDNIDSFGAYKRTLTEMQNIGQDDNTYTDWLDGYVWVTPSMSSGYNDYLPILYKSYRSDTDYEILFNEELTYVRVHHNSYVAGNVLPVFWTYYAETVSADIYSYDTTLQMVVVLEELDREFLYLTDLVEVFTDASNSSNIRLNVSSSDSSIIQVNQGSLGYDDVRLQFLNTGTVKLTITPLSDTSKAITMQICVISGFSNYELTDENGDELNEDSTLLVVLGEETQIMPEVDSNYDFSNQFGITYNIGALYNDEDSVIAVFRQGSDELAWNNNEVSINISANEGHYLYGNARQTNSVTIVATLFANLQFYDVNDELVTYKFYFDGNATSEFPSIIFQNTFDIRVLRGITDASLSITDAELENKESLPVSLNLTTDNIEEVADNLNAFVKIYKDGEQISDVNTILTHISGTNNFSAIFDYEKIQLTENVIENWQFVISNESGEIVKELNLKITWKPTSVESVEAYHYIERLEYNLDMGDSEATTEIGSGRTGVLKVVVSPDYADYDYIVVSSSEAGGDKISFTHLYQDGDELISSNQYSYYLEDGSIVIPKTSAVNGIYHLSTLIAAGLTEGTIFTITIQAFKDGETEPVATGHRTLTSVFAPYVNMTLESDFSGNLMGRGAEATISVEGVCENSTVTFSITGLTNSVDVLGRVYLTSVDGTSMSSYTNLNGVVSFDLSLYIGILASARDGYITITATVESLRGSSVITTTSSINIYIVDYVLSSIYVENAENDVLKAIIQNGYTDLKIGYTTTLGTSTEAIERFQKYTGQTNTDEFYEAYLAIVTDITADIAAINGLTRESIWYYENTQLTTDSTFSEFYVAALDDCLGVRGRRDITLNFTAMLARAYILDSNGGYLVCNLDVDFFDFEDYVDGSEYEYIINFQIAFQNASTVDEPEQITSQKELAGMEANGHYILMNDITLTNWVPLTTNIGSLDGNGHIIYLESFSLTTTNENGGKKSSINVGLFESISTYTDSSTRTTESTRLTNIILDVSRATWIDLTGIATVNFGFLAGVNEGGIIYNCEIINTVTNQGSDENLDPDSWLAYYNTDANRIDLSSYVYASEVFAELKNIAKEDENATIVSSFIFVSPTITTSGETTVVDANIGGLVGSNSGYITNSRVGRVADSIGVTTDNIATSTRYGINIFGGGRLGGLVGYNTGTIASSYFANGSIVHMSSNITANTIVGGLVAYNSGTITTSYVEGVKLENYEDATELDTIRTASGAIYFSGNVGGFVHSNYGTIENSYTNITINSSLGVGGFVYDNATETSTIRYSYSASIINSSSGINGAFTGIDRQLNTLNSGIIENCYYLIDGYVGESEQEVANPISQTDIMSEQGEYLNGFVFGDGGVWTIDTNSNLGPKLVEADNIALSNRVVMSEGAVVGEGLTYQSEQPGSASNPALIYNVSTFNSVFDNTTSTNSQYVRLIADINFKASSPASSMALTFQGELQGNGMVIEEVAILSELARTVYLGLFRDLNGAVVSNLSITVNEIQGTQSYAVGGLAGQIKDSSVNNIKILSSSTSSLISGYNITGGLTGIAVGEETKIANIKSQISIYSTFDVTPGNNETYFSYSDETRQNNISYAGGVIGVVSLQNEFATNRANPPVINCEASTDIIINAEIAGGVFGLIDYNSVASYAKFVLANNTSTTQKIEAGVIGGGVVGENRGLLTNSYIAMESEKQRTSDTAFSLTGDTASQTQLTTFFAGTPRVIAGLVGLNVGTNGTNVENQTGGIEYSYSRVDVVNSSAQVAGGVIGVAVSSISELADGISALIPSANNNYNSKKTLYSTTTQGNNFDTSFGNFSAYVNSIYNTGAVSATTVAGGFVGLVTAPMNAQYSNTALTIIPASVQSTEQYNTFTARIAGQILYENRTSAGADTSDILFVDGTNIAISNAIVASNSATSLAGGLDDSDVYDCLATNSRDLTLSQIVVSISNMNNVFSNFEQDHSADRWLLDDSLSNYIFPRLTEGQTITMQEISTVDEFFYYIRGGQGGNYRIVNDLTFDLSITSVRQNFESLSNATQAVTGLIQGYGTDGAAVTLTIIYNGTAMSLFNIIANLELSNINFVFEGDATASNYENFGLVAREAYNSTISRTSVTTSGTITPNSIRNLGGYFGVSSGCSYSNISANVNYSNDAYTNHTSGELLTGMIAGIAQIRNIVDYCELTPNFNMTFGSGNIYAGGMFGRVEGNVTISSYGSSNISVAGSINLSGGNQNVGGVIGEIDGTSVNCMLNKIDVSTQITTSSNQNIYVGGAIGVANQIALSDITTSGSISITGSAQIYAGGIAGLYENSIEFSETSITPSATFTNCASWTDIEITNTSTQTSTTYAGGLMGVLYNNITSNNQSSRLVQTSIYLNNYASGQITATAPAENLDNTVIYAGGLFGQVYNNNTQNSSEEVSTLPAIASSASSVMIFATDFGQDYLGGIAGYSSMNITNVISYGSISFKVTDKTSFTTNNNNLYLGGIVGYSKNNLSTALSLGMLSSGGIIQSSVQPIIGYLDGGTITSCYYVSDLTGIFQDTNITTDRQGNKNITNLTLEDIISPSQEIIQINVNWIFANSAILETLSSNDYYILPYISALQNLIVMTEETTDAGEYVIEPNFETQMWVQKVSSTADMQRAFVDSSYAFKSIILESNITGANELNIGNVLRILGNSKTVTTSNSVFSLIPEDVLISGFVVKSSSDIDIEQVSVNNSITYGMLAPINNGIISNCAVGGLPNYSSNTSNISVLSVNLEDKTVGENDDVLTINLNATTNSSTQIYVGGLVGQNNNTITNVWSYFDLNIHITGQNVNACYVANLVGYNTGKMNYAYAMGKQTITSAVWNNGVDRSTYLAGVLAYSTQTVSDLVGMVDFSVYDESPYNANGSLGQGVNHSSLTGVIHASDISRTNSKIEAYAGAVSSERTVSALQTTDISELGLNTEMWTRSETLNYGLPILNPVLSARKNANVQDMRYTGSGTQSSPFEISHYILLNRFATDSTGSYYALTRDVVATATIGTGGATTNKVTGNGFVIFVPDFADLNYNSRTYTTFNVRLSTGGIIESILLRIEGTLALSGSSLSVAPLAYTVDGGTVQNCAVFGTINIEQDSEARTSGGTVGGLIANLTTGTVTKSWTDVSLTINSGTYNVGGLIGSMGTNGSDSFLTQSFASGDMTIINNTTSSIGGLVGYVSGYRTVTSGGVELYTSSASIDSCYYSGYTKHIKTGSSQRSAVTIDNGNNYYGAVIGTVNTSSSARLNISNLRLTNVYVANVWPFYNNNGTADYVNTTNILVGRAAGITTDTGIIFSSVYIMAVANDAWAVTLANPMTPTQMNAMGSVALEVGESFTYLNGIKPVLTDVTPQDRWSDSYTE